MDLSADASDVLVRRAPWVVQAVAYLLGAQALLRTSLTAGSSMDNLLVVQAVRGVLHGESPYAGDRFLYPPSSVPFALLQAPLGDQLIRVLSPWVCALLLLGGWWAVLRLFGVSLRSWLGVLGVAGSVAFIPATHLIALGSWTAAIVFLTGVALLQMGRGRWLLAGLVVGLSLAVKPMLLPIGLVFLFARRWGAFAAAAGVPLVVCAVVLPLLPDAGLFFTKTLPFLLGGQDEFARPFDGSLPAVLPRFGVTEEPIVMAIRVAVFGLMIAVAVLRWRRGDDERLRVVETCAVLMVGAFVVMSPSFDHYAMVVVPALVASVVAPGAVARTVWFWISLLPFARFVSWTFIDFADDGHAYYRQSFKTLGWSVALFALFAVSSWQLRPLGRNRREAPPRPEPGIPARQERQSPRPGVPA